MFKQISWKGNHQWCH